MRSLMNDSHIPDQTKPLITFLYYCGGWCGAALSIDCWQVDLERAVIRLEEDQAKNRDPLIVPLPDVLIELLEAVEDKNGGLANRVCRC